MSSNDSVSLAEIKVLIKSLLISNVDMLDIDTLHTDFKRNIGYNIPFQKFGYASLFHFLKSIPDVLTLWEKPGGRTYIVPNNENTKSQHISLMILNQKKKPKTQQINRNYICRTFNPVGNYNDNSIKDSPKTQQINRNYICRTFNPVGNYNDNSIKDSPKTQPINRNYIGRTFNPVGNYNENSIKDSPKTEPINRSYIGRTSNPVDSPNNENSITNLPEEAPSESKSSNNRQDDCMINNFEKLNIAQDKKKTCSFCSKSNDFSQNIESRSDGESIDISEGSSNMESESDWNDIKTLCPGDIATEIEVPVFPENVISKIVHSITITHIHNPHRFWFRFNSNDYTSLLNQMNEFCNESDFNSWKMKTFKSGSICCISFKGNWYRAKYLEKFIYKAKIYLVDVGIVINVNINELRYLPKFLSTVPCQAFRGSLEGIQSVDKLWSQESIKQFFKMSCTDVIKANIKFISENVAYILAFDTSKDHDNQFFNEVLLNKKLAIRSSNNEHFQNRFPTFEMIEKSEYPSIAEIRHITLERGIPFYANEMKLFEEFENLNSAFLRELFLHFKKSLLNEELCNSYENCHVYQKMMVMENKNNSVSNKELTKLKELQMKVNNWAEKFNKKAEVL